MTRALDHVDHTTETTVSPGAAALTRLDAGIVRSPAIGVLFGVLLVLGAGLFAQMSTC